MIFGRKPKSKIVQYQNEKNLFAWEDKGNKFVYVLDPQYEARSVAGHASTTGGGGSFSAESEKPMYHCVVIPSGSTQPIPYEKWVELAGQGLQTSSAGKVLSAQVSDVTFPPKSRYALRPPSEYIKSRIRKGYELYSRAGNVTNELEVALVAALANTSSDTDAEYQPAYHPISGDDVIFELESMQRNGEVRIEGIKVRFLR